MDASKKQRSIPQMVGNKKPSSVHLMLPVSFFMERRVVEQGKWSREKSIVQMAVSQVHPLSINRVLRVERFSNSVKVLPER